MQFTVEYEKGLTRTLQYDAIHNLILDENNKPIFPSVPLPIIMDTRKILRIYLGYGCNFKCGYCHQSSIKTIESPPMEAIQFVKTLKHYYKTIGKQFNHVQFWGGEPLLYFSRIQALHKVLLKEYSSDLTFALCTNGLLLADSNITNWLSENRIGVTVSWDGPGQYVRGYDILDDNKILESVKKLQHVQGRICINPTLSKASHDIAEIIKSIRIKLEDNFMIGAAYPLKVCDKTAYSYRIPEVELPKFSKKLTYDLIIGNVRQAAVDIFLAKQFLNNLGMIPNIRPSCNIGGDTYIAVRDTGELISCPTLITDDALGSEDRYCLGHISEPEKSIAPTFIKLEKRWEEKCNNCLVAGICHGGCPYSPDKYEEYNCKALYYKTLATFSLAIAMLTGGLVVTPEP